MVMLLPHALPAYSISMAGDASLANSASYAGRFGASFASWASESRWASLVSKTRSAVHASWTMGEAFREK